MPSADFHPVIYFNIYNSTTKAHAMACNGSFCSFSYVVSTIYVIHLFNCRYKHFIIFSSRQTQERVQRSIAFSIHYHKMFTFKLIAVYPVSFLVPSSINVPNFRPRKMAVSCWETFVTNLHSLLNILQNILSALYMTESPKLPCTRRIDWSSRNCGKTNGTFLSNSKLSHGFRRR